MSGRLEWRDSNRSGQLDDLDRVHRWPRREGHAAAERALKVELSNRQAPASGGALSAATRVDVLAEVWLAGAHGWSTDTERTYRSVIRNQIKPAMGELRCAR